jgi:hypothetical protein
MHTFDAAEPRGNKTPPESKAFLGLLGAFCFWEQTAGDRAALHRPRCGVTRETQNKKKIKVL